MDTITLIVQIIAAAAACLIALLSILFFVRLRWPAPALWAAKLFISALSPVLALTGVLAAAVGLVTGSLFLGLIGFYDALIFFIYIIRITRPPRFSAEFEQIYGSQWERQIRRRQKKYFIRRRTALKLPAVPIPQMKQDVPFVTIPGSERQLLCDIWQPNEKVTRSGLAFIFLHGSAFYILDKDFCTRPFFKHLAAQGHVIMDVAYRLAPETDIMGMVYDAKRAIAWMKENADAYGVDPNRIIVGGGSAGGHLALLAAYTVNDPQFTPAELEGKDLRVCAVISEYGPTDLAVLYYHTNQHLTTRAIPGKPKKKVPTQVPAWMKKRMGTDFHRLGFDKEFEKTGALRPLLGGHPDECPETYALLSPLTHVHPGCPPTLLIHGEHDIMAPVKTTRDLYARLMVAKVPAVLHILPQTEHGFDFILPAISPSAHTAFYDVERFLALMTKRKQAAKPRSAVAGAASKLLVS